MQTVWVGCGDHAEQVELPEPHTEVIAGVSWGRPDTVNTPAYWAVRCRWAGDETPDFTSKSGSMIEEVGFCLLGGFGVKYEVNAAAFAWLKSEGAFDLTVPMSEKKIRDLLLQPLKVGERMQRYRFPNQRARRLAVMRERLKQLDLSGLAARRLRDELMKLEGIGPKTASWIVRNMLASDEVAIIDVHVVRACRAMKVFPERIALPRDYNPLEIRFLAFADAISVRPSVLDAVIWTEMRSIGIN